MALPRAWHSLSLGSGFLFAEFVTLSEPLLEVLKIKDFLKQFVEADMVRPRSSKNEDLAEDRRGSTTPHVKKEEDLATAQFRGATMPRLCKTAFVACARVKPSITPVGRSLRECSSPTRATQAAQIPGRTVTVATELAGTKNILQNSVQRWHNASQISWT